MIRSRSIELALMGSMPLLLAACDQVPQRQQETALLYEDLQQCIADGKVSEDDCRKGYQQALDAERDAPHYDSLWACEAQFGYNHCHQASGGSWFIPAVAGFLIARSLDHGYGQPGYGWSYGGGGAAWHGAWVGQPLYQTGAGRGEWRTLSGERFTAGARGPGAGSVAETLSRGGFGRTAAARASWGG